MHLILCIIYVFLSAFYTLCLCLLLFLRTDSLFYLDYFLIVSLRQSFSVFSFICIPIILAFFCMRLIFYFNFSLRLYTIYLIIYLFFLLSYALIIICVFYFLRSLYYLIYILCVTSLYSLYFYVLRASPLFYRCYFLRAHPAFAIFAIVL